MSDPRDTTPQPPNPPGEFAQAITAGLIEKRDRYIRQLEDRSRRQRLDLKEKSEFIVKCKDRIAALECELDAANKHVEIIQASRSEEAAHVAALEASNGNAFVEGAKWWEWQKTNATMFQSDQQDAAEEAQKRGYVFRAFAEKALEAENAGLREQLAAAEARLLETQKILIDRNNELMEAEARLAMVVKALESKNCGEGDDWYTPPCKQARSTLTATAEAVAEFVAGVERKGAVKELRRMAGQVGNQFVGTRRYSTPDLLARAAELEGK